MKTIILKKAGLPFIIWLTFLTSAFATDVSILGGFYDQAKYTGIAITGKYKLEITKDNATFQPGQFSINITLPLQASYDPARASEAVIPLGWELTIGTNNSLILSMSAPYSGTGAPANRRKDFSIPVITSAITSDQPTLVTIDWADPNVEEASTGNAAGSVLNVEKFTPLPVELVSFIVRKENTMASLIWKTTKEVNSDRFEIQHSLEGKNWTNIGMVLATGSNTTFNDYILTHADPSNGENLYRLKMIDKDGSYAYSKIVSIAFDLAANFNLYPNPAVNTINVQMDKANDKEQINKVNLYDFSGKLVYSVTNILSNEINVEKFPAGKYIVSVTQKNGTVQAKNLILTK